MYYNAKHEISYKDGLVLKNDQIIIPKSQRKHILDQLHIGHIGLQATLRRARKHVYWYGITNDVT